MASMAVFVNIGAKMLPSLNSTATAAERRMSMMGRRMKITAAETKIAFKEMSGALKPLAAMAMAGGLSAGLKGIFGESNEYAHQLSMLRVAGRTSKEVARAIAEANRTMQNVPTSTLNENLKILNETTLAYGNFGHALENLSFNQKMGGMLHNMLGDKAGDSGEMFNNLIRGMEIRGSALDHTRYQREAGELYKAMVATGGTVNPGEILGFAQTANPAVRGYSERFFTKIVPSLIQEFGGERAGTSLTAFNNQILGRVGVGGKTVTAEWQRLGLVPMKGSGGNLSASGWTAGSMKGTDLARSDPLAFAEQVLLPAMAKAGIDINNSKAVGLEAKKLFGRETGARLAGTLLDPLQRSRLHKDEGLFNKAMGPDKAFAFAMKNDPKMAWAATAASLKNLETIIGKAITPQVIGGLQSLARGINWVAGAFDANPNFARGVTAFMGLGAAAAMLRVFEISIRWVLAPFGRLIGFLGYFASSRLGGLFANGLIRLGPILLTGLRVAFGILSGPVGWAILAASAVALVVVYRKQIAAAWNSVTAWFRNTAWPAVRDTVGSINWGALGIAIADGITFGLASRLPSILHNVSDVLNTPIANFASGKGVAWTNSTAPKPIIPTRAAQGAGSKGRPVHVGEIHVHGAHDPHAAAKAVQREIKRMAMWQGALLND